MTAARGNILVVMNRFQGYETLIPQALEKLGYSATWTDARLGNGLVVKVLTRLGVLQRIKSVTQAMVGRIIADAKASKADTVLMISPETLGGAEIRQMRAALPGVRLVLYLWDSSANRKLEQDMIDATDAARSFDLDDCDAYQDLVHVPLFHPHETFTAPAEATGDYDYEYCFIGTARVKRLQVLAGIARRARQTNERVFFYLFAPSTLQYIAFKLHALRFGYDGVLSRESIPYQTYLGTLAKSACVIDVEQADQGGLTIRTMDAVFAGRPLATTNPNIARHDFYPHFPVSMFSTKTLDIEVPTPRQTGQAEVFFHKYQIGNWLETILSETPDSYRLDGAEQVDGSTLADVS